MSEAAVRTEDPAEAVASGGTLMGDTLVLRQAGQDGADAHYACAECGHRYGPADQDPKLSAVVAERRITDLSVLNAPGMVDRIVAREFYCPGCGLSIALNIQEKGDPIRAEWTLDPATLPSAT